MRTASRIARPALVGLAALALAGAGLVVASPTAAATHRFEDPNETWTVPAGVTEIHYSVAAGPGGAGGGPDGGQGGIPLIVSGTLSVTPGEVLRAWVGGPGTPGGSDGAAGTGGAGFRPGGDGGTGGTGTGGGGGGGGSSALAVGDAEPFVIVGGAGGGGGSPLDTETYVCFGGSGGPSGEAGSSPQNDGCSPTPAGGAAGLDSYAPGAHGADVSAPEQDTLLAGVGGGGGGGGQAGVQPDSGPATAGAGGGGGQVVHPDGATVQAGIGLTNGYVEIEWEEPGLGAPDPEHSDTTLPATGPSTAAGLSVAGGLLVIGFGAAIGAAAIRRRTA